MNDKKFTVQPQFEVILTQQDIDDIMSTALEGGIIGWCNQIEVVGEQLGRCASEQISKGGSLILYDLESSDKWELTLKKFLDGVKLYFEDGCHVHVNDGSIDPGDIDANDADCIIQFALFGEVVFG